MQYSVKIGSIELQRSDCLILGVFNDANLNASNAKLNSLLDNQLKNCLIRGDLSSKVGQTLLLPQAKGAPFARVLLVNCGPQKAFDATAFQTAHKSALLTLRELNCREALCALPQITLAKYSLDWKVIQCVRTAGHLFYQFDAMKSKKSQKPALRQLVFLADDSQQAKHLRELLHKEQALAKGIHLCKDLGNLPGNVCTPSYLAKHARSLTRQYPALKVKVLEEAEMKKLGMGALLAVNQGSIQAPKLIILEYNGAKKLHPPVALVGKGVTFDSGGISIKPSANMDEMKYDMCGAASVLATLVSAAELKLPINIVGLIGAVENMPSGKAVKPGDIVTSLSGQTIEILNTDAEGRLVLCDVLTYCQRRYKPDTIIDIATLTGAIVIALGKQAAGIFTPDDKLATELAHASDASCDRIWRMPLYDEYHDSLKSNFADVANCGDRAAGSCTAAAFLSRFTQGQRWAHIDIAGVAWESGNDKGATGRPVPLLLEFLWQRSQR